MSTEHHLKVQKTARVYTSGHLSSETKYVWLIAHGYGMLSRYFLKKFECLDPNEHYLIAPEALSRFYTEGLTGKIGASWMTAEDREAEMADYTDYLDKVYEHFVSPISQEHTSVIALGFSQGCNAMFRWANKTCFHADILAGWGGSIPPDVLDNFQIQCSEIHLLIGDNDAFIPLASFEEQRKILQEKLPRLQTHIYSGGHQIDPEVLIKWIQGRQEK